VPVFASANNVDGQLEDRLVKVQNEKTKRQVEEGNEKGECF
jgi:hypothetical protein